MFDFVSDNIVCLLSNPARVHKLGGICTERAGWDLNPTDQQFKLTLISNCFFQRQRITIQVVRKKIGSG